MMNRNDYILAVKQLTSPKPMLGTIGSLQHAQMPACWAPHLVAKLEVASRCHLVTILFSHVPGVETSVRR